MARRERDITVLFHRGGCEASMPLGDVTCDSSVILADTSFVCTGSSGTVSPGDVSEQFEGVIRDTPDGPADVNLCVRHGDNDDNRSISVADLERHDLVQVTGLRADPENDSLFGTGAECGGAGFLRSRSVPERRRCEKGRFPFRG